MNRPATRLYLIPLSILLVGLVMAGPGELRAAENIISCYDFAAEQTKPSASPVCAPLKIENEMAFDLIKTLRIKKSGYDYIIALPEREWEKLPPKMLWSMMSMGLSAIQSLYDANSDIYFAAPPKKKNDQPRIIAHARYVMPKQLFGSDDIFPSGHHHRRYVMIINGLQN